MSEPVLSLPQPCGNVVQDCEVYCAGRGRRPGRPRSVVAARRARPRRRRCTSGVRRRSPSREAGVAVGDRPGRQPARPRRSRGRARRRGGIGDPGAARSGSPTAPAASGSASRNAGRVTRVNPATKRRRKRDHGGLRPVRARLRRRRSLGLERSARARVSRIAPKREQGREDDPRRRRRRTAIAVAFGKVWVADYGHGRLIRIDPVRRPRRAAHLAAEGRLDHAVADALWVSSETGRSTGSTRRRCRSWRR